MSVCIWESIGVVERGRKLLSATRQAARKAVVGFDWGEVKDRGLDLLSLTTELDDLASLEAIGVETKAPRALIEGNAWFVLTLLEARQSGKWWHVEFKVTIHLP